VLLDDSNIKTNCKGNLANIHTRIDTEFQALARVFLIPVHLLSIHF